MTSDGHLSTRIPLFSPRNNRLVLARPTRRFRRRAVGEKKKKRSGTVEEDGRMAKLGAKDRRSTFSSSLRPRVKTRGSIERGSRDQEADDRRSKDEGHGARRETM